MPQAKELVDVGVHHRATNQGLHMLADSSGVKFLGEGEWKTKKHGAERRRQWWCKVHLSIDAQTLQIRAIAATTNEVGDSPMAADLLGQIPNHEEKSAVVVTEEVTGTATGGTVDSPCGPDSPSGFPPTSEKRIRSMRHQSTMPTQINTTI